MLVLSWVTEKIAIGSAFLNEDISEIKNEGIEAVVDVRSEYSDDETLLKKFNMKFLHIEVDDRYTPSSKQLQEVFSFLEPLLNEGKKVLIHCQNGYGRSPLVAIALLHKRGMKLPQAINLVKEKHPLVSFTPEQEKFVYNLKF